jgi:hypothetical protein
MMVPKIRKRDKERARKRMENAARVDRRRNDPAAIEVKRNKWS